MQRSDGRQIPSAYLGYCGGSGHNAVCRHALKYHTAGVGADDRYLKIAEDILPCSIYRTIPEYPVRRIFPELYRTGLRDKERRDPSAGILGNTTHTIPISAETRMSL